MQRAKARSTTTPVTDVFEESRSKVTRTTYPKTLKKFFDWLGLEPVTRNYKKGDRKTAEQKEKEEDDLNRQGQQFLDNARADPEYAFSTIKKYILEKRERVDTGEITAGTLKGLYTPIKMFCAGFDDIFESIKWERIQKLMPTVQHFSDDKAPDKDDIKKLCEYPDRRIKAIVLIMYTSGIRIGSFEGLRWKHINNPIYDKETGKELQAAWLKVAKSKQGPYKTLITPECYNEVVKYIEFRKMWGEKITDDSWVIRNDFKTADIKRNTPAENGGGINGRAETPRQLKVGAINRLLVRALYEQGIRHSLPEGKKRHPFKTAHGLRKAFETTASFAGMHGLTFEMLMGHRTGLTADYMRPTDDMIIAEYRKVVPALTITEDVQSLKKQQDVLEAKQKEKDVELEAMKQAYKDTAEMVKQMKKRMDEMDEDYHNLSIVAEHFEKVAKGEEES